MRIRRAFDYTAPLNRRKRCAPGGLRRKPKRAPSFSPCKGVFGGFLRILHDLRDQILDGLITPGSTRPTYSVRTNVRYELKRQGITIPFPILDLTR